MSAREALILRAASVWTAWIWGTRITNILSDPSHSTSFKAVHTGLALVSICFAAAIWAIAGKNRRRMRQLAEEPVSDAGAGPPDAAARL